MIIGIDLGTTNSVLAFIDENGTAQIIPNREGERTTPSVILFERDKPIVGTIAKNNSINDPINTVQFVKRQMGNISFKFITEGGESFTSEELAAIILKRLKNDAEEFLNYKIEEAVITVPAYFDDSQRKATQDAAEMAGLKALKIINEPTAAALAYATSKELTNQNIMVYDLGGGTFDITIMNINDDKIEIKASGGHKNLGGFDFDNKIIEQVCNEFTTKYNIDLYDHINVLQELREKAEICKKNLSSRDNSNINISCLGNNLKFELSRNQFNEMIRPMVEKTIYCMESVLEDSNLNWHDLNKIILVGGSTRVPLISEMIENKTNIKCSKEVNPDEVVAIGAAIQANLLSFNIHNDIDTKKTFIIDVSSHSLGVVATDSETKREVNSIILQRNTPIPAENSQVYFTLCDNQNKIVLSVTEGEDEELEYVRIVGKVSINIEPKPIGYPVRIKICIDINGIINVFAYEEVSGLKIGEVFFERNSNLSDDVVRDNKNKISKLKID